MICLIQYYLYNIRFSDYLKLTGNVSVQQCKPEENIIITHRSVFNPTVSEEVSMPALWTVFQLYNQSAKT